jgi:hypothetical protein
MWQRTWLVKLNSKYSAIGVGLNDIAMKQGVLNTKVAALLKLAVRQTMWQRTLLVKLNDQSIKFSGLVKTMAVQTLLERQMFAKLKAIAVLLDSNDTKQNEFYTKFNDLVEFVKTLSNNFSKILKIISDDNEGNQTAEQDEKWTVDWTKVLEGVKSLIGCAKASTGCAAASFDTISDTMSSCCN